MAEEVADGLVRRDIAACTVTVKVRYPDFTTVTRSRTFAIPTANAPRIGCDRQGPAAPHRGRRAKGCASWASRPSTLVPGAIRQLELFDDA